MSWPLTLLYTVNLQGELEMLPRLYSFLRQQGPAGLLLDAGGACAESVWHCAVTGGRSMLHVMDAMGYDALYIGQNDLSAAARAKLDDQAFGPQLIDSEAAWLHDGVLISGESAPVDQAYNLQIVLKAGDSTTLTDRTLRLATLDGGSIGQIRVEQRGDSLVIAQQTVLPLPDAALPDPTIAATVDFVLDEARYYQRRKSRDKE